jgi:hypothetical protein
MPISRKTFDSSNAFVNPKLLEFFTKNKDSAFTLKEIDKHLNPSKTLTSEATTLIDITILIIEDYVESKFIGDEAYYQLKLKK